ncbi:hypothetical protein L3Y34_008989 [Caenorhabditis briggsae]|uniref:Uncharacterized protein n=1 Tax=Caenorhabditis briggsae TaxID=6238 RepID=A0AAE9A1F0_CAEBR|nr:hypothetical protein L3Y34_008989 [Caenorhabditis briggsae]
MGSKNSVPAKPSIVTEIRSTSSKDCRRRLRKMGSRLSVYYGTDVPDFTDDIVYFKCPNISGVDEEDRNNFYNELCESVNATRDDFEKDVQLIERKLFSCLHALSHMSFEYKSLIEIIQKESLKILNSGNVVPDWKTTFMKTVLNNLKQMNLTANVTGNRGKSEEQHIETKQNPGVGQEGSDEQDSGYHVYVDGKTGTERVEVAEENKTLVEVISNGRIELDQSETENQKDNEIDDEEEKIGTENVEEEKAEENKTTIVDQENGPIEMGVELTEESNIEPEKSNKKEKTDTRMDDVEADEENVDPHLAHSDQQEPEEFEEFNKLLASKIEKGKVEEELKQKETQSEINDRMEMLKSENDKILIAKEEYEKAMKDFQALVEKRNNEFLEAEKAKQEIHEEEMKRIRQTRKEFEEETERIRLKDLREIRAMMFAFSECIRLKLNWEIKEDEWGSLLKRLKASVSRTKNQFIRFLDSMKSLGDFDAEDTKKEELSNLHSQTFSTYDTLYEAYLFIKMLSTEFQDRKFLVVLQKRLSDVCQCILSALLEIDNAMTNQNYLESLKEKFSKFDSSDIFYTSKLREMEKNFVEETYQNIVDPEKYIPKSEVVIDQMSDSNEAQPGNVEEAPDHPNHEIGEGKRQTPEDLDTENTQPCY